MCLAQEAQPKSILKNMQALDILRKSLVIEILKISTTSNFSHEQDGVSSSVNEVVFVYDSLS